jgi:3-deoxy-manno-octulosonate cytidylyltransferase (CMP-KDO synthetase)
MHPVILIPARLGSTRLPNKPLADIHGAPMIVHVWRRGMEAGIGPVWVACDDTRIKDAVENAGGQAVMTRSDHASGSDRIYEALQAIDPSAKHDIVVNLQGDVPTIAPGDIRACLAALSGAEVDIATLACEIRDTQERGDPSVVKPVLSFTAGSTLARALYFSRASIPHGEGPLYHHIGIYAYRRAALARFVTLPPSSLELREKLEQLRALEAGMHIAAAMVETVPLGVDTQEHLEKARRMLATKKQ